MNKGFTQHHFMHYVYLLLSRKFNEIYVGSTNNLRRRFFEHNHGVEQSTRRYRPWSLVYYEAYFFEKNARDRETRLKKHGNALRELKKRAGIDLKNGAGFTLLMTLLYITASLGIGFGIALLIAGEVALSGTGRDSQFAFYAADFGAECALYWDLKHPGFAASVFTVPPATNPFTIRCGGNPSLEVTYTASTNLFTFSTGLDNGTFVAVSFKRLDGGGAEIIARGHNIPPAQLGRRVERGLKVEY